MGIKIVKNRIKTVSAIFSIFFFGGAPFFAASFGKVETDLSRGLSAYRDGDFQSAALYLKRATSVSGGADEDTMFLLIRSEMNAGEKELALSDCEDFLRIYDASRYLPLVLFSSGKLLGQLGRIERAVLVLSDFCHRFPDHELYPDALFWMAEAFLSDYDFQTARALYSRVVNSYPESEIAPEARSRLEEIARREREEKLLYLLKVTGEENLSTREDYERQLRQYQAEDKIGIRRQLSEEKDRADALERELASIRASSAFGGATGDEERAFVPDEFAFNPSEEPKNEGAEGVALVNASYSSPNEVASSNAQAAGVSTTESVNGSSENTSNANDASSFGSDASGGNSGASATNAGFEEGSGEGDDLSDEEYEKALEGLRRKARRIQQMMDERQFINAK